MTWIIQRLNTISSYFYQLYVVTVTWVYPFNLVTGWFYQLSLLFSNLAWDFYYFSQWIDSTTTKLLDILSWSSIQNLITNWFFWISDLSTIFYHFWSNVTSVINNWWLNTSLLVQGWIDNARALLQSQLDSLNVWLFALQTAFDDFKDKFPTIDEMIAWFSNWWSLVLAQIILWGALTGLQIQSLIDTAFTIREQYWQGWQDWKAPVSEFFADPLQWLYNSLDEFFERFW